MKHFRSEYAFQKYRPHISWRKKFLRFFRKKQYTVRVSQEPFHYKANPFKTRKKPESLKIKIVILIILLALWAACLSYLPYFKINKISYAGLTNTTRTEMDEFIYKNFLNKKSILPVNNYFFINTDKISRKLHEQFSFESADVAKIFPNRLSISIKEKISSIIYDNGKSYWLLDSGGTVIKYLKEVELYEIIQNIATTSPVTLGAATSTIISSTTTITHIPDYKKINKLFGNYPLVYDKRNIDIVMNQEKILPSQHIAAIIAWHKNLAQEGIIRVKFFILDNLNSGITIKTEESWNILFQPKNNTDTQINNLKNALQTVKPQEYIDLRFGEKLYWK